MNSKRIALDDGDDGESLQNKFSMFTQDTISEILSRTTPLDVSRFAAISKGFKSSADSETAWTRFVPMEIVSRSDSPIDYSSISELYFRICNSPIIFDGGTMSFYPERKTATRCFMVGARQLIIAAGDNSEDWEWTSDPDSRFSEVAKLKARSWLDIRGQIDTRMLSQNTNYGAYLVFKITNTAYGLESVNGLIRFVNRETDLDIEDKSILLHLVRGQAMYRMPAPRQPGQHAVNRPDGWMEVELGSFFNDRGDYGVVEARLMEIWRLNRKSGLIVEGIEFRLKTTPRYIEHWKIR